MKAGFVRRSFTSLFYARAKLIESRAESYRNLFCQKHKIRKYLDHSTLCRVIKWHFVLIFKISHSCV